MAHESWALIPEPGHYRILEKGVMDTSLVREGLVGGWEQGGQEAREENAIFIHSSRFLPAVLALGYSNPSEQHSSLSLQNQIRPGHHHPEPSLVSSGPGWWPCPPPPRISNLSCDCVSLSHLAFAPAPSHSQSLECSFLGPSLSGKSLKAQLNLAPQRALPCPLGGFPATPHLPASLHCIHCWSQLHENRDQSSPWLHTSRHPVGILSQ